MADRKQFCIVDNTGTRFLKLKITKERKKDGTKTNQFNIKKYICMDTFNEILKNLTVFLKNTNLTAIAL